MTPFDLEAAKNGASVCLIDETPVKILDFDFNSNILCKAKTPEFENRETVFCIDNSGKSIWPIDLKIGKSEKLNVFMAPVYAYAKIYINRMIHELYSGKLCTTTKEAAIQKDKVHPDLEYFCMAKIEMFHEEEGGEE